MSAINWHTALRTSHRISVMSICHQDKETTLLTLTMFMHRVSHFPVWKQTMREEQPSVRELQSKYWARKLQPEIIKLFPCRSYVVLVAARLPLLRHKCRQNYRSWQNPITMDMAFAFFFFPWLWIRCAHVSPRPQLSAFASLAIGLQKSAREDCCTAPLKFGCRCWQPTASVSNNHATLNKSFHT